MTEKVQQELAIDIVADPQETVIEDHDTKPEEPIEEVKKHSLSQDELDEIISKRLAKERRKIEREFNSRTQHSQENVFPDTLGIEYFETPELYAEYLAERKAEVLYSQRKQAEIEYQIAESFDKQFDDYADKHDDFLKLVTDTSLPITDNMASIIRASDIGAEVLYHLGKNPSEASRISKLSPLMQAKELGKLESVLSDSPTSVSKKTVSTAPDPVRPISGKVSSSPTYDTTDPRSIKTMSTSDWIKAERERQIRKLSGKN